MLTNDHPNVELLKRVYGTGRGDGLDVLDTEGVEPFVAHTAGHSPIGGTFVGRQAMKNHVGLLRQLSGETVRRKSIEFYADDVWGVVPQVITASRNGQDLEMHVCGFWRFSASGQLAEHWEACADTAAWDAFWHAPSTS
ncbi:hypothetical protein [Mycobacterium sp. HNNTM2301]|uniref:hypothetical protein n=1 Tax=Mycobacterium hainanense TaxID=3289775 RepID=UPI0035A5CFBA